MRMRGFRCEKFRAFNDLKGLEEIEHVKTCRLATDDKKRRNGTELWQTRCTLNMHANVICKSDRGLKQTSVSDRKS